MSSVAVGATRRRPFVTRLKQAGFILLVTLLLIITLFPILWLVQMSLKTEFEAFRMPPSFLFAPTLQNYRDVLDAKFIQPFANSTVVSTATTAISLLLGVPAAYALSRARFRSERVMSMWTLSTRMAPPIAFGIPFFLIYRNLDLIDTRVGLIIVYLTFNLSLVIWMMRTFFDGLPKSLEEAAYIDGAGIAETFFRVTLPLSAPGLATTAILCFLLSWNDFFYALVLTRSEALTAPVAIVNFQNYESWEWGKVAAAGTLVMLPVVVFSLAVRRYLIRGLTAGALKE